MVRDMAVLARLLRTGGVRLIWEPRHPVHGWPQGEWGVRCRLRMPCTGSSGSPRCRLWTPVAPERCRLQDGTALERDMVGEGHVAEATCPRAAPRREKIREHAHGGRKDPCGSSMRSSGGWLLHWGSLSCFPW